MEQYFSLTIQLLYLNTYPTKSVNVLPTAKATFRGLFFFFINLFRTIQSICLAPPCQAISGVKRQQGHKTVYCIKKWKFLCD